MTSFAVRLEPVASPRMAAAVLLFHGLAAAAPWLARVPATLGAVASTVAAASLLLSLARLPGRHCALTGIRYDGRAWRLRLAGSRAWLPAELDAASRAYPRLAYIRLRSGRRRAGWLLADGSVPAADFRRLKALIRLAC
jgi:hypothetical protein